MVLVTSLLFIMLISLWVFSMLEANLLLAKVSAAYAHKYKASIRLDKLSEAVANTTPVIPSGARDLPDTLESPVTTQEDLGIFDYLCLESPKGRMASHHWRICVYDKNNEEAIVMRIARVSAKTPCSANFVIIKPGILSWAKEKRSATLR